MTKADQEVLCNLMNLLQDISDNLGSASQQTVAVVQSAADEGVDQGRSCASVNSSLDAS